jgi:hypothetical protein
MQLESGRGILRQACGATRAANGVRRRRRLDEPCDLSAAASGLASLGTVAEARNGIVALAVRAHGGCDAAGLFSLGQGGVHTEACTDPHILSLDRLQFETDRGPCLDALRERCAISVADLALEARWQPFAAQARRVGVRSVLAIPLAGSATTALVLYGRRSAAFSNALQLRASVFATLSATALEGAEDHAADSAGGHRAAVVPLERQSARRRRLGCA